jgi:hypothetical protein
MDFLGIMHSFTCFINNSGYVRATRDGKMEAASNNRIAKQPEAPVSMMACKSSDFSSEIKARVV